MSSQQLSWVGASSCWRLWATSATLASICSSARRADLEFSGASRLAFLWQMHNDYRSVNIRTAQRSFVGITLGVFRPCIADLVSKTSPCMPLVQTGCLRTIFHIMPRSCKNVRLSITTGIHSKVSSGLNISMRQNCAYIHNIYIYYINILITFFGGSVILLDCLLSRPIQLNPF